MEIDFKIFQKQLDRIEQNSLLSAKKVLTIDDVSFLFGLSKSSIYKLTMSKALPCYKPNGRSLFFNREDVEAYLLTNRKASKEEFEQQAIAYTIAKPTSRKGDKA